ncbi:MAG TPA: hypothetical protein VIS95_04245 [Solirubrobacterales bacterium]
MARRWLTAAVGAAALCCAFAGSASAAAPDLFWKIPEDGKAGGEAGRFNLPGGLTSDPDNGHLFIADRLNGRIVELTAWGEFVKAWGWGVVASGPGNESAQNERQRLTVSATAGTYRLKFFNRTGDGGSTVQTTVPISFNWPAGDPGTPGAIDSVQETLEDIPTLKAKPGSVVVTGGPGDAGGSNPYEVEFVAALADRDIPPLGVTESTLSGGGASATVTTLQSGGSFEICVPANGDVCQAGQTGGSHPGEISNAFGGVALDAGDNVYVYESFPEDTNGEGPTFRVQKFDSGGNFLAMWGGDVNKTKVSEGGTEAERNLCTKAQVEAGDECGTGVPGSGKGQFGQTLSFHSRIAVGPTGAIFVGDVGRIQKFTPAGAFDGEHKVPGETIQAMAMDGAGNFYASFSGGGLSNTKKNVRKLVPSGEGVTETMAFPADRPLDIAVDSANNVYVIDSQGALAGDREKVMAYDESGTPIIVYEDHLAETGDRLDGLATGEGCGVIGTNIYVPNITGFLSAYGPAPIDVEACPPPKVPPTISKQFATAVGTDNASIRATINPQFWADTRYYVEYGTGECSKGGCDKTKPAPPGAFLTSQVTQQPLKTDALFLAGLLPDTTYHFRFVAESTGGGPVFGVDPDGIGPEEPDAENGLEGTFKTHPDPDSGSDACPNASFRTGASSRLPDCRAYEMVSPVDKENGDIIVLDRGGTIHARMALNQSSVDGERLTYSSYRAFGDAQTAPFTSTYLATRDSETGWASHGISPPRGKLIWEIVAAGDVQYRAFSDDLCDSWLVHEADNVLDPGAPAGFANVYRRDNCGAGEGDYDALIPVAPPETTPAKFIPEFQGVSPDGSRALFRVRDQMTEDAAPCTVPGETVTCKHQLFEALPDGSIRFVCVLPGGEPAPNGCSAGTATGANQHDGRSHTVAHAISADGSRIFWSDVPEGLGRIYVRLEGQVTLPVSEAGEELSGLTGVGSQYWTAAEDGSVAIFTAGQIDQLGGGNADLYEFRVAENETTKIAGKVYGLLGASADAKRIYLVSGEAHDAGAIANEPNLYLYEAGEGGGFTFIGTLSDADAIAGDSIAYSPVTPKPKNHVAQVTEDGLRVAFMSTAPLTGYDNSGVENGEPHAEVFLYDAVDEELRCVSCNPTGALPSGRDIGGGEVPLFAAAQIPITQTQIYPVARLLSENGRRLYFESFEALEPADTNGRADVYQWEALGEGPPQATCTDGSPSFNEQAGGCVDLISSGTSEEDSSLVDVSADGNDVFIATAASLLSQDPDLVDIYDARVGGGFPSPSSPPPFCEGEACQAPPPPPADVVPGSSTYEGPGNPAQGSRLRCSKRSHRAKVRGKTRCVRNGKGGGRGGGKRGGKPANNSRGAGR